MILIFDDFLKSYQELKQYSLECNFTDIENPADGVVYPHICADIPDAIKTEVIANLSILNKRPVKNPTIFLRMSPEGVSVPHMAHNDSVMGDYSFMLYLNENPESGTALIRHKESGITYQPESQEFIDLVVKDQNNEDAWHTYYKAHSKENRAAIFDSGMFHRAEPYGGFGKDQADSRIVLTCFFS